MSRCQRTTICLKSGRETMKRILLTGGGTGGHIYPLIAVADKLIAAPREDLELHYIGPKTPLIDELTAREIQVHHITPAKIRRYFDLRNIIDIPKFFWSLFEALFKLLFLMPDVVFSKGGPGTFAVVLAARFYMIPAVIHESDAVPSLTSRLSAKFAKRIIVSFESTLKLFPQKKMLFTGNPVREALLKNWMDEGKAKNYLGFDEDKPLILVLGGSQGSERINNLILENLETALGSFQIYHQVGDRNLKHAKEMAAFALKNASRTGLNKYILVGSFKVEEIKFAMNAADIVLSRAGAGAIFEIAAFHKPSVLIPLKESANDHQRANAYEYAKTGAAIVVEEENLKINILINQINGLLKDKEKLEKMSSAAKNFAKPEAAEKIAQEILLT